MQRECEVVDAWVGTTEAADGDGAYDIAFKVGTPEEIGAAIGNCLRTMEVMLGRAWYPDNGRPIWVQVKVKITPKVEETSGKRRMRFHTSDGYQLWYVAGSWVDNLDPANVYMQFNADPASGLPVDADGTPLDGKLESVEVA